MRDAVADVLVIGSGAAGAAPDPGSGHSGRMWCFGSCAGAVPGG